MKPQTTKEQKAAIIYDELRRKFDLIGIAPKKDWLKAIAEALDYAGI